jgi:N-methylhydantoinase B
MEASNDEDFLVFLSVERVRFAAAGRHGGQDGAKGRIRIGENGPDLPSKGEFRVPHDTPLILETPGGGGFGPPSKRSAEDIQRDVDHGLVSSDAARADYGATSEGSA